uniref:efflux RND transporter periplasmic adaptor subunit n=1 Tax=Thaumasiovibrio occultus TaxID=1891184 RepID=UPI000B3647FF|nr:efflux RND transporter periplasmic adaptor subunit [Thaumasiovibrio occultus]
MNKVTLTLVALAVGAGIGYGVATLTTPHSSMSHSSESTANSSNEPLYWVAPMDPNYRRDAPGKSPMGMDLVPVYEGDGTANDEPAGTVYIDPAVENNLGVKSATVERKDLFAAINTVGYIGFNQDTYWQINLRVSGWVGELHLGAVGERVTQGDVLFTLYSPEWVKVQEELLNAARTGRRAMVRGAKQRLRSLGMADEQIEQVVKQGRVIEYVPIIAPADGVVDALNIREGAFISPQQLIVSAGALDTVWVDAEVFERQSQWVNLGDTVTMSVESLAGKTWQGTVDYIYPVLDAKTRGMRVRITFANPDLVLKPNMYANIQIHAQSYNDVLVVPRQAIIHNGDMTRVVLALGDGKYRSARIVTGRQTHDWVEITEGLTLGDKVVTSAQFMLDSESSQSADLSRINGIDTEQVEVEGYLIATVGEQLKISHLPVEAWDWPAMVMNFDVTSGVSVPVFEEGTPVRFTLVKEKNQYRIVSFAADTPSLPAYNANSAVDHSSMDHSAMGHSSMDHSTMGHATMDHGAMAHGDMDHAEMDHSTMNHAGMDHSAMGHDMSGSGESGGSFDFSAIANPTTQAGTAVNHAEMDHGAMGHGSMNQSEIDHSEMGHGITNNANSASGSFDFSASKEESTP